MFHCLCVVYSQQQIYVASVNNIWRLMCTPVTMQIKQLLACKEFELALHLAVSHSSLCLFHNCMENISAASCRDIFHTVVK